MTPEELYVAGVGSWLPEREPVERAVADGRYDPKHRRRTGQVAVAIAGEDETQPVMAVRAGQAALRHSGIDPERFRLLLHAVAGYHGLDGWNAASYLQQQVLGGHGLSFEVHQLSNGAVASMELAAAYLATADGAGAALITTADCFPEPVWDRWSASPGLVFGDGASALVLARDTGFAKVRSIASTNDPQLEGMQRGDVAFSKYPDPGHYPINLRARTNQFSSTMSLDEASARMARGLRAAADRAADEAGVKLAELDHVLTPNFGRELLDDECLRPLEIPYERTVWEWGLTVGHVGAADQFAGLAHLCETEALRPGEHVMLVGVGGGFNWTCAVLEILEPPAAPERAR